MSSRASARPPGTASCRAGTPTRLRPGEILRTLHRIACLRRAHPPRLALAHDGAPHQAGRPTATSTPLAARSRSTCQHWRARASGHRRSPPPAPPRRDRPHRTDRPPSLAPDPHAQRGISLPTLPAFRVPACIWAASGTFSITSGSPGPERTGPHSRNSSRTTVTGPQVIFFPPSFSR